MTTVARDSQNPARYFAGTLALAAGLLLLSPASARAQAHKSFCEAGYAQAAVFGAGGAVWVQTWGGAVPDWFTCTAGPNVGILNEAVVGELHTTTTGIPSVDFANLILRFPFAGTLTLVAPGSPETPAGTITGEAVGTFVADLNAAHAVVTDETILIQFGKPLHQDPDALITITETTGKFKSIQALDPWEWHVSGTITIARVPALSDQDNIFAALQNPALLLGAEESVVLTGAYLRTSPVNPRGSGARALAPRSAPAKRPARR